ncbi:uncharacterized protein LOC109608971 isoform X2 [Aethina tumida]|uniref:uncharacterized protein LOC109608971 isoform X2 n=1 Tax=Aethina tumida TaxID=116153 RepID=UPI00096B55E6|nr:uncharacterized protein LOC109608971 isoform X2 [Aethina tumida]
MKCYVSFVCALSVLAVVSAAPYFPNGGISASTSLQVGASSPSSTTTAGNSGGLTNILSSIDLPGLLRGVNSFVKLVGAFCPPLSQVLDNVIQNVTSTAFRVFGRAILRSGGLGGGSSSGGGGQRVNVVLPTFPPDEDYEEEEEESQTSSSIESRFGNTSTPSDGVTANADSTAPEAVTANAETTVSPSIEENTVAKRHVRVVREADQQGAESAPQPAEDLSNINIDDQDRNKRYLPFGGSVDAHASGGSGNFLFDIIRLVAGSGATEESDEKANSPGGAIEVDIGKTADGYTEGIPGPITRLFVIANRGIANLVQDLILRLAQTSERLVNFKARLVTSLI